MTFLMSPMASCLSITIIYLILLILAHNWPIVKWFYSQINPINEQMDQRKKNLQNVCNAESVKLVSIQLNNKFF